MKETAAATDLTGKTALITGAGRGIGRTIALGLAETRAMLLARDAATGQIRILPADLGDQEERTHAIAAASTS